MDVRLVPLALGAWCATAGSVILASRFSLVAVSVWGLVLVMIALATRYRFRVSPTFVSLFTIGVVTGLVISALRVMPVVSGPIHASATDGAVATGLATVVGDPTTTQVRRGLDWASTQSVHVAIRIETVRVRGIDYRDRVPVVAWASQPDSVRVLADVRPGMQISFSGRLRPSMPGRAQAASLIVLRPPIIVRSAPRYQWLAERLRVGLRAAVSGLPIQAQSLVPGLALGDSSAMSSTLASDMKAAGLTHLIAVSGTNVTLLIIVTRGLLRRWKFRFFTEYLVVCGVLAAFVVIVRPQPSVLRAVVMGVVALSATFVHARRSTLPILATAVLVLLLVDPWLAVSYGFALSVAATAGLLMWGARVSEALDSRLPQRIPNWVLDTLAVTLCAQLAVLPLMIALGSPLSFASIPANMIAVPLAGPAMVSGIVVALLGVVDPRAAHLAAWVPGVCAIVIADIAHIAATATWLEIPWIPGMLGVFVAFVVVMWLVWTHLAWAKLSTSQRNVALTLGLTVIALLWIRPTTSVTAWPPNGWVMTQCDIGQGDGAVINLGNHQAMVIDVGPDPVLMDSCLSSLKIHSIPVLVLTHFHADHVGGLEGAFHRRRVGEVRVTALADPPMTTRFVTSTLKKEHVSARIMTYPEHIVIGDVDVQCLWVQRIVLGQGSDPNNASVVLLVRSHGSTILMTGDIEPAVQSEIMKSVHLGRVDVIKVPHHGSANQLPEFADWVHAHDALISVGKNNDYGHPAPETVMLYGGLGARVWRTDRSGDLAVVSDGHRTWVVARKSSPLHGIVVLWQRTLRLIQRR